MPASGLDPGRGRGDSLPDSERDICGFDTDGRGLHSSTPPELRRSANGLEFNAILNHPDILPMVSMPGQESLDAAPLVADPKNYLIMVDGLKMADDGAPVVVGKVSAGAIFFAQHDRGFSRSIRIFLSLGAASSPLMLRSRPIGGCSRIPIA